MDPKENKKAQLKQLLHTQQYHVERQRGSKEKDNHNEKIEALPKVFSNISTEI